jgi:hypothetical protein
MPFACAPFSDVYRQRADPAPRYDHAAFFFMPCLLLMLFDVFDSFIFHADSCRCRHYAFDAIFVIAAFSFDLTPCHFAAIAALLLTPAPFRYFFLLPSPDAPVRSALLRDKRRCCGARVVVIGTLMTQICAARTPAIMRMQPLLPPPARCAPLRAARSVAVLLPAIGASIARARAQIARYSITASIALRRLFCHFCRFTSAA